MIAAPAPRPSDDSGITLIELVIAGLVGAILLGVLGSVFVTTLQSNAATRDRDLATGRVQAISTSLSTSVRNASDVVIAPLPGGGAIARARVATGTSAWECRAWAVVDLETWTASGKQPGADGRFELRTFTYPVLTSASAPSPMPTTAWGALATDVRALPGTPSGSNLPYFSTSGQRLLWNLGIRATESANINAAGSAVSVTGSALAQAFPQGGTSSRC